MQGQLHWVIYTHPPPSPRQGLQLLLQQHISSSRNAQLQLQPSHGLGWLGHSYSTHSLGLVNPGAPTAQGASSTEDTWASQYLSC